MNYYKYLQVARNKFIALPLLGKTVIYLAAAFLLIIGVYLINPAKKMLEMRNSQRRSDVASILNAAYQYSTEHGSLPFELSNTPKKICRTGAASCEGLIDFSQITADKKYQLNKVPVDPIEKDQNSSGYEMSRLANGRINVVAPNAEKATISLSK